MPDALEMTCMPRRSFNEGGSFSGLKCLPRRSFSEGGSFSGLPAQLNFAEQTHQGGFNRGAGRGFSPRS